MQDLHEGRPECVDDVGEGDLHFFWNASLALAAWQRNWQPVLRWSSHASHHVRVVARCRVYRATSSAAAALRGHGCVTIEDARGGLSRRCWKQRRPHRAAALPPRVGAEVGTVVVIGSI
jgi:hypothetical protein